MVIAVVLGLLMLGGVAQAHQLPFGIAKTEIKRLTADICAETEGCRNWRVSPCERKSEHRIDCVSTLFTREGGSCAWVTIARAPRDLYEVRLNHKRIFC
ncbi:MAG TPA: hypothetical protein VNP96_03985 [Solirubrobacterales bacterium]|nr:hypothetical protein [Solirubrobacterales bacterium]